MTVLAPSAPHGALKSAVASVLAAAVPAPPVQQTFQPGHSLPGPCTRSGMSTSVKGCTLGSKAVASSTAQETSEHTLQRSLQTQRGQRRLGLTLRMIPPALWRQISPLTGQQEPRSGREVLLTHDAFKSSINHTPSQGDSGRYTLRKAWLVSTGKSALAWRRWTHRLHRNILT